MTEPVTIDGASGEGGGQILRSALSLAVLTGTPLRMHRIRARRRKPGLLLQHRAAIRAAATISGAHVRGDELGSSELEFEPQPVMPGHYRFSIGSAGSGTLVLQTVLWPLLAAPGSSVVEIEGGTHNPLAPPFEFFDRVLAPPLRRMGARFELALLRHGFYPAGGGHMRMTVEGPTTWRPLQWIERGPLRSIVAEAVLARLPGHIAQRELDTIGAALGLPSEKRRVHVVESDGPGNAVAIEARFAGGCERFTGFGERRKSAEVVARSAVEAFEAWARCDVPVGEYLADQLLVPLALAGAGSFRTTPPTLHTRTNADVIARFLPVAFHFAEDARGCEVSVTRREAPGSAGV